MPKRDRHRGRKKNAVAQSHFSANPIPAEATTVNSDTSDSSVISDDLDLFNALNMSDEIGNTNAVIESVTVATATEKEQRLFLLGIEPEIRNMIYKSVLTLDENYKCAAQFLVACKQINDEASGYLYGKNNTFDVQIYPLWMTVNGAEQAQWPAYLRKCERLRFSYGSIREEEAIPEDEMPLESITAYSAETSFKSLCEFLLRNHRLKTLIVDLSVESPGPNNTIISNPTPIDLYPLRLITSADLQVSTEGVVHPLDQARSPIEVLEMTEPTSHEGELTPEAAVNLVYHHWGLFKDRMLAYTVAPIPQPTEFDLPFIRSFLEVARQFRGFEYIDPGVTMYTVIYLTFDHAINLNLTIGPATFPDDPRHIVYGIKHALVRLTIACNAAGIETETYLRQFLREKQLEEHRRQHGPHTRNA